MNQKGMMFTLEVLIAIVILAIAIGIVLSGNNYEENEASFTYYLNRSNRITSVYFEDPIITPLVPTGDTMVCGDIWKYESGTINKKTICEGYT